MAEAIRKEDTKRACEKERVGLPNYNSAYLGRLGGFLEKKGVTQLEILRMEGKVLFSLLLNTVSQMERARYAGGYIPSMIKAVKS